MKFKSFFQAGFECSTGYNRHGHWIDQVSATRHDLLIEEDYARLAAAGIYTVREGVRWPLVSRQHCYDLSTIEPVLAAAEKYGIEIIHDLFHFGYPDDIDLFSPDFPARFADYCYVIGDFITRQTQGICYFTPINEPSYFSWAAGEVGLFAPHQLGRGYELKKQLIAAAIQGINALHAANPKARLVNADPLCHVIASTTEAQDEVDYFNSQVVFQSWDMLSGQLLPELGGSPKHLDIVGINYYWTNQWESGQASNSLDRFDPRRASLSKLIRTVWERYQAEIVISETGELEYRRAGWMHELAIEATHVLNEGIPLRGICLYPILGMPEWHTPHKWTQMGLWELDITSERLERVLHQPMMEALRRVQYLEKYAEPTNLHSPPQAYKSAATDRGISY